jgi:hypothetical protein
MMKLESKNATDWQGFSRILEIISFIDAAEDSSPDEVRETADRIFELAPSTGGQLMSMEEVVFWAGVASGMEISRQVDEENIDPETAEKMFVFSSIFSHSTRNAIVNLALGELDSEDERPNEERRETPRLRRA